MKTLLKYTIFALIAFAISSVVNLDGIYKTVFSKGLFIALTFVDKFLINNSDLSWQDLSRKKLFKLICKLPKYVAQSLV